MREAIVAVAGRCIIERGHAALSTRAVAAAAGVNQSLIHYYFGTRERLMLAVLEQMLGEQHLCMHIGRVGHDQVDEQLGLADWITDVGIDEASRHCRSRAV